MSDLPPPSDLSQLSGAEKDALIRSLLAQLETERNEAQTLRRRLAEVERDRPGGVSQALLAKVQEGGRRRRPPGASQVKVSLGRGLGFLRSRAVVATLIFIAAAIVLDRAVGWYQAHALEQRRMAELRLQYAAFTTLYVELEDVAYEADGKSYRLTLALENRDPESPIYVMLNPVRAFEQIGMGWKEVPAGAAEGSSGLIELTDRYTHETIFEPYLEDWAELIPGYMHIRFDNDLLISQRSEPDDDIVERKDPYYVYLKPHGADDQAIRERMNYAGPPPVYIPMPPH